MKEECSSYNWSIVYCRILERSGLSVVLLQQPFRYQKLQAQAQVTAEVKNFTKF